MKYVPRTYRIRPDEDLALKKHLKNNPDSSQSSIVRGLLRTLPEYKPHGNKNNKTQRRVSNPRPL